MVLDVQTFMEISASIKDYGCAKGGNKHVSIAISVLNDWLPNAFFFPAFDKLATSIYSLVCFYGNLDLREC